jgi:hypothetical protein
VVTQDSALDPNGLLERVMADPFALCARVLEQVLERLASEYAVGADEQAPEQSIALALGDRLADMLVETTTAANGSSQSVGAAGPPLTDPLEELFERDCALAAALGACDCWGELARCPICHGAGTPGWALPDRQLFAEYVHPALRALTKRDAGSAGAGEESTNGRKEDGHV